MVQEHADRSISSLLQVTDYAGVIEYEPSELYIQNRSGTSLREIKRLLAQHGQILAFDRHCLVIALQWVACWPVACRDRAVLTLQR